MYNEIIIDTIFAGITMDCKNLVKMEGNILCVLIGEKWIKIKTKKLAKAS